jgi:hypothetical protein
MLCGPQLIGWKRMLYEAAHYQTQASVKMYYFLRDNAACFRLYFVGSLPGAAPGRKAST